MSTSSVTLQDIAWGAESRHHFRQGPQVGIEIETESMVAYNYAGQLSIKSMEVWKAKEDGSLRNFGVEYISTPLHYEQAKLSVSRIIPEILAIPGMMPECPRAGIHVHVNVRDMTIPQIWTMACIYWLVENELVEWCGESRVGNNFCLRLRDATRTVGSAVGAIRNDYINPYNRHSFKEFSANQFKYAALNIATVNVLGTLEFRSLDGTLNANRINNWIDQVVKFRELAIEFGDPVSFFSWLDSNLDREKAYEKIFTPYFYKTLDIKKISSSLYTNASFALSVAFACPDWKEYNQMLYNRVHKKTSKAIKWGAVANDVDDDGEFHGMLVIDDPQQANVLWQEDEEEVVQL